MTGSMSDGESLLMNIHLVSLVLFLENLPS